MPALRGLIEPIAVVAMCLVAVRPWAALEAVCSDDFTFHLLRLVQLESLLKQGVLFSRWAPDMAYGYGFPFFNFYAPLSYYVGVLLSLVGLSAPHAVIVTFVLATIGAGLAAYKLARDIYAPRSALVVAAAYVYAPYLGYDAFFRGNLAETMAWVFIPLALWTMGRLVRDRRLSRVALAALAYGALLLTHNVFALIFSPLLAGYAVFSSLVHPTWRERFRSIGIAALAMLLGMALAAFFWVPALIDQSAVHIDRLLVPPIFVYWNNFITLKELLTLPRVIHPDLLNPSPARGLGIVPVLLGFAGLIGLVRFRDPERRIQVVFFALAVIGYSYLTVATSAWIWQLLQPLQYVQFPWRMLGPAALCLAMLVGASVEVLPAGWRGSTAVTVAILAALVLGGLFWIDPRYCPADADYDVADIIGFEKVSHTIGTTAKGEYLPKSVEVFPADVAVTVFDETSLPVGTIISDRQTRAVGADLVITATESFTAVYNGFYFPGWQVSVDGEAVSIVPDRPYGRITFPVPEGYHDVLVHFTETPWRRVADAVSLIALFGVGGLLLVSIVRRPARATDDGISTAPLAWGWCGVGLGLLVIAVTLQHVSTPIRRPRLEDGRLVNLEVEMPVDFEGGLTLLGYEADELVLPSDGSVRVDLFWTAREPPSGRYQRALVLVDDEGLRWNPKDSLLPRDLRQAPETSVWPVGTYVLDSHTVEVLSGTPPGEYTLKLTLLEHETLQPMRVLDDVGQPSVPEWVLATVVVTRPLDSVDPEMIPIQTRMATDLGSVRLLGFDRDREAASPGDPYQLTLFWLVQEETTFDVGMRLELIENASGIAASFDLPPVSSAFPSSLWQEGDVWRGRHVLRLPVSLADGEYDWRVTLTPGGDSVELPAGLNVTAPRREFTMPDMPQIADSVLGDVVTLVGFAVDPVELTAGESLSVTLVWQAEAETTVSYRVFVHVVGPDGRVVAQSDGIPVSWERPTTGWLPGEYVTDVHWIDLPEGLAAGSYSLSVGFYEAGAGRLGLPDGADAVDLGEIAVENY